MEWIILTATEQGKSLQQLLPLLLSIKAKCFVSLNFVRTWPELTTVRFAVFVTSFQDIHLEEMMACAKGPAEFCPDGDSSVVSTSWAAWVEEFEAFADSKGVFNLAGDNKKDMRTQRKALLLYHAGARVREIHSTLTATARHAYDDFLTGLNTYFTVEPNETFQRHIFRKMIQLEDETVSQYCARLRKAANNGCNYNEVDKMIRDQIVEYCLSDELRKKLMEEGNGLDLAKVLQLAATHEAVDIRFKEMSNRPLLNRVSSGPGSSDRPASVKPDKRSSESHSSSECESCGRSFETSDKCGKCGRSKLHEKCPAIGKQCHKCHGYNHFSNVCKAKKSVNVLSDDCVDHRKDGEASASSDSYYAFTIHTVPRLDSLERVRLDVGGANINAIIDTGANCNVISMAEWNRLKQSGIQIVKSERCTDAPVVYSYASKTPLKVIGQFWASVAIDLAGRVIHNVMFQVVEGESEPLLGIQTCKALELVKINVNHKKDDVNLVQKAATSQLGNSDTGLSVAGFSSRFGWREWSYVGWAMSVFALVLLIGI